MFPPSTLYAPPTNTLSAITPPGAVQPPDDRFRSPIDAPLIASLNGLSLAGDSSNQRIEEELDSDDEKDRHEKDKR
jgi:hypothetical protein